MKHVDGHKLLNFASQIDDDTIEQAKDTASMPFVHPHVALMPDAHVGKGSAVGTVIPTLGAVIPAAVGVDIGCGMIAARTKYTKDDIAGLPLPELRSSIEKAIPMSRGGYNDRADRFDFTAERIESLARQAESSGVDLSHSPNWRLQLGTLGGGNHFIELCLDNNDHVWMFLHSGSRGVGNKIANRHIRVAQKLMAQFWIKLPNPDLAYLPQGTREFTSYMTELKWAQAFALANRAEMMNRFRQLLATHLNDDPAGIEVDRINCLAGETQVITRTGVRPIETLAGGQHELLTDGGEWIKAPVEHFGRQDVSEVVLIRSGVLKTIRATAEHRWLLLTRCGRKYEATTAELRPGDTMQTAFAKRPQPRAVDRLAAASGFVYGGGSAKSIGHKSYANFCGTKDEVMIPFFKGIGNPVRTYGAFKRITGLPREWKKERPPIEDLAYVRAACQAAGIGTFGIRSRLRRGYGDEPTPTYLVGIMRGDLDSEFFLIPEHRRRYDAGQAAAEGRHWRVVSVRTTGECTDVYCAVVEGTHSFTLADNILTGNCHHNYTTVENHGGKDVWITRKGAINANKGVRAVIPGSMGTRSYIVTGLGNKAGLCSAPHGAGRRFSRNEARRRFNADDLAQAMRGIEYRHGEAWIDEIPAAYKDIDVVMDDARELVRIDFELRQILNVKGE